MTTKSTEPSKTIITWNGQGGELDRVIMRYDDATGEAIAQAVIDMLEACMAMAEGDSITVTAI